MPQFEVFNPQSAPREKQPYVSLQRKGTFTLNKAAFQALGEPSHVELLFDRAGVIGFRPVDATSPTAYAVRATEPSGSYAISGSAFVKHYDIDTSAARRWPAQMDAGVLVVRIADGQVVQREPRARLDEIGRRSATKLRPTR